MICRTDKARQPRTQTANALKLLSAWDAVLNIGASDAFVMLATGEDEIGPQLRKLSTECRRWIKRHGGFRKEHGAIVAKIARRAES
jgi:hypothetical protein